MEVESYSEYVISVQACNGPALCSEQSESISVKTQIGGLCSLKNWIDLCAILFLKLFSFAVPSAPGQPSIKSSTDNSSSIDIKWTPPAVLAGPTYMSVINITGGDMEFNFTTFGACRSFTI